MDDIDIMNPDQAANAGEALSLTPRQRAILATRAMAHVAEYFTRERMAYETLNVYAELLEAKRPGRHTTMESPAKLPDVSLIARDAAE